MVRSDEQLLGYRLIVRKGDNITAAHLHCGASDQVGPVVATLYQAKNPVDPTAPFMGTISENEIVANTAECNPGIQTTAHLVQAMREGKIYINVHSLEHPDGEIRGQLRLVTEIMPAPGAPSDGSGSGAHLILSGYFILPPAQLVIYGYRFAPREEVQITVLNKTMVVTADDTGHFVSPAVDVTLSQAHTLFTIRALVKQVASSKTQY